MFGLFGEDCGQVVREDIGSSLVALLSASAAGERKVAAAFNTFLSPSFDTATKTQCRLSSLLFVNHTDT